MLAVLLSLFVAVPALPVAMRPMILAQADQASCVVVFADGARVSVSDWIFRYQYGESDSDEPTGVWGELYQPLNKKTRDLLITTACRTEHGVSVCDERSFSSGTVASIKIAWEPNPNYPQNTPRFIHSGVVVSLVAGDSVRVADLWPARGLLSQKRRLIDPHLYLEGTATIGGKAVPLSVRLNKTDPQRRANDRGPASETVLEVRFQGGAKRWDRAQPNELRILVARKPRQNPGLD
ncbi:MAG TPA: hypothetical protein VJZ25_01315 [Gemmatimonadaceae bacterium]|nr:hypothetical protein [Gemmatimonadaceae bacterium]